MPNRPESENEYNRLEVECISPDGVELGAAWIYEVTPAVLKRTEGTRISDGIWPI